MAIDDQLQFKIDEKMRQLHRKEMQAQMAAKYEDAARARQVLNTGLFSRSLNTNKGLSAAKPPPRLHETRQNTFTILTPPQAAPVKTKSRSMVEMRYVDQE